MNNKSINVVENRARELFESLFPTSKKSDASLSQITGNIDGLNNKTLTGWVVDQRDCDASVEFSVFLGDTNVGAGIADIYREDLKLAGYGSGKHGFQVTLDSRKFCGTAKVLVLVDKLSGKEIKTNPYSIEGRADFVAEVTGIVDRRIAAEISTVNATQSDLSVEILVDGCTRLPCAHIGQSEECVSVEAVLPEGVFDGGPHTYEVIVNNANCTSSVHVEVLHSVTTPDEFIADSIGKNGYPFASKVALQRYQSVVRQFEDYVKHGEDVESIRNLLLAHGHMEGGVKKRRSYETLQLPYVETPDVSVIISARNHFSVTYHCIASLILARNAATFEVILVDDESEDETVNAEEYFKNIRVIRNKNNKGYLLSNNIAATYARGRYLCLLNNDTEVTAGWIDSSLQVFSQYKDVGSVGCKLIYPDSSLQEAGGLVWKGGVPWNYGKGANASHPRFNYVRPADYLSAAALFIETRVWFEVEGFSDEYVPAYYEDTDLAYKIRDAGYRTLYCPFSTVIHFEGVSNGQDVESGVKAYQNTNADTFKSKWHKSFRGYSEEGTSPSIEVDRECQQRILVIDANTPKLNNDAGSYAAIQEMKLLMELGSKISFLPLNFAHMGVHTERLQRLGIECLYYPFYVSLEHVLQARGEEFDVVYITRYETVHAAIELVRKYSKAQVIFNNADLHFMRELREQLQADDRELTGPLATREQELNAIRSVDLTLCYTETERAVIASHVFSEDAVMRCPWVIQSVENSIPFEQRTGIAFLGGFQHRPNVEAIKYFCTQVMPLLTDKLPDLVFHVYGSGMPDEVLELESTSVKMVGYVENISDVFAQARIFICPLLTGAGLNGKIIDCIAHGLPAVVSPITADGTGLVHRQNTMIAETTEEWVDYISELYTDPVLWLKYAQRTSEIAGALYSGADGVKRMSAVLARVGIFTDPCDKRVFSGFAE